MWLLKFVTLSHTTIATNKLYFQNPLDASDKMYLHWGKIDNDEHYAFGDIPVREKWLYYADGNFSIVTLIFQEIPMVKD